MCVEQMKENGLWSKLSEALWIIFHGASAEVLANARRKIFFCFDWCAWTKATEHVISFIHHKKNSPSSIQSLRPQKWVFSWPLLVIRRLALNTLIHSGTNGVWNTNWSFVRSEGERWSNVRLGAAKLCELIWAAVQYSTEFCARDSRFIFY